MKIRPLYDRIMVKRVEPKEQLRGGIISRISWYRRELPPEPRAVLMISNAGRSLSFNPIACRVRTTMA